MGQFLFRLPDVGEGVAEAEIAAWHVKPGQQIGEDQPLVDVMTDKATVEMTSPVEGIVTALHGEIGKMAPVGSVLVEMEVAENAANNSVTTAPIKVPAATVVAENARPGEGEPPPAVNPEPTASPATRRRAMEWGIKLEDVAGSGPHGRILTEDLERYRESRAQTARPAPRPDVEEIRIAGLRRRIADRMTQSKLHIPHFTYVEEMDLTELESLRAELNQNRGDRPKLTLLPFFIQGLARLLPEFPDFNAHYDETAGVLRRFAAVHVGIAVQTGQGLMAPVIRHAESRGLWECAGELARMTALARDGKAASGDLAGSTITLTSLGALGGISATPIINPPEVAIIGPNKLVERPVIEGAFLTRRKILNVSASFDHRIIDGYDAARFIQQLRRMLEHPALLFLE